MPNAPTLEKLIRFDQFNLLPRAILSKELNPFNDLLTTRGQSIFARQLFFPVMNFKGLIKALIVEPSRA